MSKKDEVLNPEMFRQGDVLIVKRASMIGDVRDDEIEKNSDRTVLAHGEVTGHAHAFYSDNGARAAVYNKPKGRHLRVVETDYLRHEEHSPIEIPAGDYDLPRQVEWTDEDEPIAVRD